MRTLFRILPLLFVAMIAACSPDRVTSPMIVPMPDVCGGVGPAVLLIAENATRAQYQVYWCDGRNQARVRTLVVDRVTYGQTAGRSERTVMEDYRSCESGNTYADTNNPCIRSLPVGVRVLD